jgi:hypothetical protein
MTRPIRLFEEEAPDHDQVKKVVRRVGLAAAGPILAFGLCPANDEKHGHGLEEDHRPLPIVGRLTTMGIGSTSGNSAIPFFGNTDHTDAAVMEHWHARRAAASFTAMSSRSTLLLLTLLKSS